MRGKIYFFIILMSSMVSFSAYGSEIGESMNKESLKDYAVNGGFERVYPVDGAGMGYFKKAGFDTGGLLTEAWNLIETQVSLDLRESDSAFEGRRALQINSGVAIIWLGYFQVIKPSPITIKVAVRGPKSVRVLLYEYFRGAQKNTNDFWMIPDDPGRKSWQVYEKTFTPEVSARALSFLFYVGAPCAIDAFQILAPPGALAPLPILNKRMERDDKTLLLVNFDEQIPENSLLLGDTEKVEGPFGKAMRFKKDSILKIPAAGHVRKEEGTIEFWARLDFPENVSKLPFPLISVGVHSGYHINLEDCYDRINFFANQDWKPTGNVLATTRHWGRGSWRHVAVTWSGDTWQVFIDGIMVNYGDHASPSYDQAINESLWKERPNGFSGDISIGSEDIVLAEIRFSTVPRYGWIPADLKSKDIKSMYEK